MKKSSLFWMMPLLLGACGGEITPGNTPAEGGSVSGLPTEVATVRPQAETALFIGTVESADRGVLAARTDGRVSDIRVEEGSDVRPGELLLTLADTTLEERRSEAEGARQAAAAHLALAEQTEGRYRRLFEREAVTPQEMDRVAAELAMARQQLRSAEAALAAARTAAAYTRVAAPYAAQVARVQVEEGTTVQPGTPLLVLDRAGRLQVRADIAESWAERILPGQVLEVEIPALPARYQARVIEVASATDPRSRTFQVRLELPADAQVHPGMHARILAAAGESAVLRVPETAIVDRGQLHGIYVVSADGRLQYRMIRLGRAFDGEVEILAGLTEGERFVRDRVAEASNGARLEN